MPNKYLMGMLFCVCTLEAFSTIPIFKIYPNLASVLPHMQLGTFPTPVYRALTLEKKHGLTSVYFKMDGMSGGLAEGKKLFGGNKVRKLEFLLADALAQGAATVITQGGAGSNHALCTAVYCKQLGIKAVLNLKQQPNSYAVQRNLLRDLEAGAQIYAYANKTACNAGIQKLIIECTQRDGRAPYVIPTGGSCPRGIMGFINAVFELKEQIDAGFLPEPNRIYVPLGIGSSGTAAGLLIGIKAADLHSTLVVIAVEPEEFPGQAEKGLLELVAQTVAFVRNADASFPHINLQQGDYEVITTSGGAEYGLFTPEGSAATNLMGECEHIALDGTYTAKACAGFLEDCIKHTEKKLLFWHTYDGCLHKNNADYTTLPNELQRYFTTDVQELDKGS